MKKFLSLFAAVLFAGSMWALEETISFASPTESGEGTSYTLLWDNTSCSILQEKGTSSTSVSSSYKTSPRWYASHLITFTPKTNVTISKVVITASGSSNNGQTMTFQAGTGTVTNTSSTVTTVTGSWTSAFQLKMGTQCRVSSVVVTYSVGSSCDKKVTISKGTPSNGDFTLDKIGDQATCDAAVTVIVTPAPADHYKTTGVTAPNSSSISGPDGDGKYTVTYAQNTNAASEINVTFVEKDKYTVTWNNNGETSTSKVYDGEKPVFPTTPTACDATSTSFIGWATAAWDGKLANLTGKTVYTTADEMPAVTGAVTYYAVFAKVSGGVAGWVLTDIADITASDVFVFADANNYAMTNDNGTSSAPAAVAITVSEGKVTSAVTDKLKWQLSGNATDGYTFYPNGSTTTWLYCNTTASSGSNNNMRVGTGDRKVFVIDGSGYLVTSDDNTARYVSCYNNQDFRGYINTDLAITPKLYKYSAGSVSDYMTTCAAAGQCETPTFSVGAGSYTETQSVELACATEGAKIYYTLNGTDPTSASTLYSAAISVSATTTIKAIAVKEGNTDSGIAEATYHIIPVAPTFTPAESETVYTEALNVTIAAAEGATIYYTTDGSVPTTESAAYTAAVALTTSGTHTIKAIAVKGDESSAVASATYTIALPSTCAEVYAMSKNAAVSLNDVVVTYVSGKNVWVKDATGAMLLYLPANTAWSAGTALSGVEGTLDIYNGLYEVKPSADQVDAVTATPGDAPDPENMTTAPQASDMNKYVILKSVKVTGSFTEGTQSNITMTVGETDVTLRNQFKDGFAFDATKKYDVVGLVSYYNAVQVYFISAEVSTTTAIDNAAVEGKAVKFIENGQLFIEKAGVRYNVMGQIIK